MKKAVFAALILLTGLNSQARMITDPNQVDAYRLAVIEALKGKDYCVNGPGFEGGWQIRYGYQLQDATSVEVSEGIQPILTFSTDFFFSGNNVEGYQIVISTTPNFKNITNAQINKVRLQSINRGTLKNPMIVTGPVIVASCQGFIDNLEFYGL